MRFTWILQVSIIFGLLERHLNQISYFAKITLSFVKPTHGSCTVLCNLCVDVFLHKGP